MPYAEETVFDLEADGLLDTVTKIHCVSIKDKHGKITLTDYNDMRNFFGHACRKGQIILIGHNIICYDLKVIDRILGVKPECQIIDTLPLSWYLEHSNKDGTTRQKHGLEEWGEEFGVPKPKIDSWTDLSLEEYCHRCEQDTEINYQLWLKLKRKLQQLYD